MHASMVHGAATSSQFLFDVRVQPAAAHAEVTAGPTPAVIGSLDPALKGQPLVRYDLLYILPATEIGLAASPYGSGASGEVHRGSLEFDIAAYDGSGRLVTGLSQTGQLALKTDEVREFVKSPFQYTQQIDLPPGALFLRVGILDGVSHKVGTLEIPLTVARQ